MKDNNLLLSRKFQWFLVVLIAFAVLATGCQSLDKKRRAKYVLANPELTPVHQDFILRGKLWVGMTPDEVKASRGKPTVVNSDPLGKYEIWSYIFSGPLATRKKVHFERCLKLEFYEGRLGNWYEY